MVRAEKTATRQEGQNAVPKKKRENRNMSANNKNIFSMPADGIGSFYSKVKAGERKVPNSVRFQVGGVLEWRYAKSGGKIYSAVWSDGFLDTTDEELKFECQKIIENNERILSNLGVTDRILPGLKEMDSAWATIYKAIGDIDAIIVDMPESPSPLIDAAR